MTEQEKQLVKTAFLHAPWPWEYFVYNLIPPDRPTPWDFASTWERATSAERERGHYLEKVWRRWNDLKAARKRRIARDHGYRPQFV